MAGRGFPALEFEARVKRAQALMARDEIAALLLTTEPDIRYFSGFLTRFWQSPTRPWFLVVPASGAPIAVIPSIGADLMSRTWVRDIRTWRSPDLEDDGVSLLADTLKECVERGAIAVPNGHETHLRMPLADFDVLKAKLGSIVIKGDNDLMRALRMVKSDAEVVKIERACEIAGNTFARVHEFAKPGVALEEVFRRFQMTCLDEGADWVPYLAGGLGKGGYSDVISPASDQPLTAGDVLMLDTGLVFDGYFSDFDRNYAIGKVDQRAIDAHARLIDASDAAYELAKPGVTASELFHAMDKIVTGGARCSDASGSDAGRFGHGLGMQLTEWPSLIAADHTVIEEGMVLTLEPGIDVGNGRLLVHEENIVITESGARMLSPMINGDLPVIG